MYVKDRWNLKLQWTEIQASFTIKINALSKKIVQANTCKSLARILLLNHPLTSIKKKQHWNLQTVSMKGIWIFTCLGKALELREPRFWPARQHLGCPRAWGPHRFRGPTVSSHGDCIHSGAACPGWTAPAKQRIQNVSSTDKIIHAFWNVFMLDKNHLLS